MEMLLLLRVERLEQILVMILMLLLLLVLLMHLILHLLLGVIKVFLENVCVEIILAVEVHVALDTFRCRSRLVNYGQVCVEVSLSCCAELTTIDGAHELKMIMSN